MTVSVVINTCNESAYIDKCLKSVEWADEIVVIDMESADDTVEKCRRYTQNIFTHPRVQVVEMARDFAISKATCDWILVLDPDEQVSDRLRDTLRALAVDDGSVNGYYLPRLTYIFGKLVSHSGWGSDKQLRFFRRGKCRWPQVVHSVPVIDGEVGSIEDEDTVLIHDNYRSVNQFIEKMNRYTDQEARRLQDGGRSFHWLKLFYQPGKEFYSRYVKLKGYKDGIVGLILALMMAFYVQLSYIKLWELRCGTENDELKGTGKDACK